jgi:flagellin
MSVTSIGIKQALLTIRGATEATDNLAYALSTGKKVDSAKDDPIAWVKINKGHSNFKHLESIKTNLSEVALSIRIADQSMQTISTYIDQMKAELLQIRKTYPPYPPGSEQRIKLLRSFNGFRKLIEQLTIPPESYGAQRLMAAPAQVPEAGPLNVVVSETGFRATIKAQEVHTGPTGLDIPELADDATDAEIDAAAENLSRAQAKLETKRSALAVDAATVSRYEEFNKDMAQFHLVGTEKLQSTDDAEVSAQLKSSELRATLALESIKSLTGVHSLFSELLN